MKSGGKKPVHSDVSLELIATSGQEGIKLIAELRQRILHGFGMPAGWVLCIVVSIFKGKDDTRNCSFIAK